MVLTTTPIPTNPLTMTNPLKHILVIITLIFVLLPERVGAQKSYSDKELVYHALANARYAAHYKDAEYLEEDNVTYGASGIDTYTDDFADAYDNLYSSLEAITTGTEVIVTEYNADETITTTNINDGKAHIYKVANGKKLTVNGVLTVRNSSQLIILAADAEVYLTRAGKLLSGGNTTNSSDGGNICILGKNEHPALVHGRADLDRTAKDSHIPVPFEIIRGAMHFNYTKIYDFTTLDTHGGLIYPNTGSCHAQVRLFMANTEITNLLAKGDVRAFIHDGGSADDAKNESSVVHKSRIYLYNCNVHDNTKQSSSSNNAAFISSGIIGGHHESSSAYRIKNCTFTNNKSNSLSGGVVSWNTQTTNHTYIIDCTFTNNQSYNDNPERLDAGTGGAISCRAPMIIKRCVFDGNSSTRGGGAIVVRCPSTTGTGTATRDLIKNIEDKKGKLNVSLELDNETIFRNNTTDGNGGAILVEAKTAIISGTGFSYTIKKADLSLTIDGAKFENNSADKGGGAIAMSLDYGSSLNYETGITIKGNAIIDGNHADENGGAIYMENVNGCDGHANNGISIIRDGNSGTPVVKNNIAENNGGAVYFNVQKGDIRLEVGDVHDNSAKYGGALWTIGSEGTGKCILYDDLNLHGNTTTLSGYEGKGSDLYTDADGAYFTLGEDVTYGPISVQRGTAGHMIDLNGHKYNDNLALPGITLTGAGSDGVFALCGDGWVNVVHALRDNGSTGGGNSSVLDYPTSLASDTRLSGDVTDNTLHQTYGLAYSRTGRANSYGTVMVPFTPSIYANVKLYSVTAVTDEGLVLREVAVAQPNVPYIYRITTPDADGHTYSMYLATNQNLNMDLSTIHDGNYIAHAGNGTQLIGRYVTDSSIAGKTGTTDNGIYYLKDDSFSHSTGTITVNPYRAYLKVPPTTPDSPARSELPLVFDDTADGISMPVASVIDILRTEYYTLDGRRLAAPQRGTVTLRVDTYTDGTVTTRKVR